VQTSGGPILTIYTSYDMFLRNEMPFEGRDNCTCIKIISGLNFLKLRLIP